MVPRIDIPHVVLFLLAIIAPGLLTLKLDTKESVASYSLQRILRQFGFDQGTVWITGSFASRACGSLNRVLPMKAWIKPL